MVTSIGDFRFRVDWVSMPTSAINETVKVRDFTLAYLYDVRHWKKKVEKVRFTTRGFKLCWLIIINRWRGSTVSRLIKRLVRSTIDEFRTLVALRSLGGGMSRILLIACSGGSLKKGGSPSTISITMMPKGSFATTPKRTWKETKNMNELISTDKYGSVISTDVQTLDACLELKEEAGCVDKKRSL